MFDTCPDKSGGVVCETVVESDLDPKSCSVGRDIFPVLDMPQVSVLQGHLDGSIDTISNAVHIPGVNSQGSTEAWRAAHKLRHNKH